MASLGDFINACNDERKNVSQEAFRKIDLSNYSAEDLIIKPNVSSLLSIQFKANGGSGFSVLGKNANAEDYILLAGIDMGSMDTITNITKDGIYNFDISGVDIIEISLEGTNNVSTIYVKTID